MNMRFLRVSDIVNALFYNKPLQYKPFQSTYDRGTLIHEARQKFEESQRAKQVHNRLRFLSRRTGNIYISGAFDALRVLKSKDGELAVIIEYKTGHIDERRIEAAKFQLQLYIWLAEPELKKLGIRLHKRHYIEILDLARPVVKQRIVVEPDENIEVKIWQAVYEVIDSERS